MRAGGAVWTAALRAAVDAVINRVAWDDVRTLRPLLESRDLELAELRARVAGVEQALAEARNMISHSNGQAAENRAAHDAAARECARIGAELEATQAQLRSAHQQLALTLASRSWRMTAPLRALRRLAPPTRTSR
jgi:septal ring factor EnvC (AmiA/AmiB activator)